MAFEAYLTFTGPGDSKSIKVLECDFGFSQNADIQTAKPSGRVLINNINLVVESSKDTQLADWMFQASDYRNGVIEITVQNNVRKTIRFWDAFCVQYHESFNYLGDKTPMHISLSFIARKIELDDNVYYELH